MNRYTGLLLIFFFITVLPDSVFCQETPVQSYQIINEYPHNSTSFTQGLVYYKGNLFESTGLWGQSKLLKIDIETGETLKSKQLKDQYFGEGLARVDDKLVQLTWQSNIGFVYDIDSFELIKEFSYPTEGWGITYDNQHLIMSDGSNRLYFLDPNSFEQVNVLSIYDQEGNAVTRLNELEYINGEIFANIWQSDRVARINPQTGKVKSWIDFSDLQERAQIPLSAGVLNGIAYDEDQNRLFVTGKRWPKIIEVRLDPQIHNSMYQWKIF